MPGAVLFDTLRYAKRLRSSGFNESQAEVLATLQAEIIEDNLATKQDLKQVEVQIKGLEAHIKEVEARIKEVEARIKELEVRIQEVDAHVGRLEVQISKQSTDIIKWVIGLLLVQTGIIVSAFFAVARLLR
jgi:septal ring factor EnvC (AmiA/AmiB activator)